jgi:hypothetical protein
MKKLVLIASLILLFVATYGQGDNAAMFKLRGGLSIPFGSFGKNKGALDYAGFASNGTNLGIETVYFYSENVGIGGILSHSSFKIDAVRLAGAFINSNSNYDTAFVNVNPFKTTVAALGFYFDLPVTDYFAFSLKMLGGSHIVKKPSGVVTIDEKDGTRLSLKETSTFDSQFALYFSAGIRVNPYDNWNITMDVEYVGSKLEFDFQKNGVKSRNNAAVKTLVFSFGIAYFLN